jgi:hypothetical protein
MKKAFAKYYFDLTRYNVAFSILIGIITSRPNAAIITFLTFGMIVGFLCFRYFQNNQYYFYYNLGISKSKLLLTTWVINALLASILLLILL